jgi:hypothetical protein
MLYMVAAHVTMVSDARDYGYPDQAVVWLDDGSKQIVRASPQFVAEKLQEALA